MRLLLVLVEGGRGLLLLHAFCELYFYHRVGERVSSVSLDWAFIYVTDEKTNGCRAPGDASYIKEGCAGAGAEIGVGGDHQKGGFAQRGVGRIAVAAARERVPAV